MTDMGCAMHGMATGREDRGQTEEQHKHTRAAPYPWMTREVPKPLGGGADGEQRRQGPEAKGKHQRSAVHGAAG